MPTLKYVGNAGRYRLTNSDVDVAQGETVTVDEDTAAHLQEHGEFEVADKTGDETVGQEDEPPDPTGDMSDLEETINGGECPWCDKYEGDAVGQHAASAHPDAWDDYKED